VKFCNSLEEVSDNEMLWKKSLGECSYKWKVDGSAGRDSGRDSGRRSGCQGVKMPRSQGLGEIPPRLLVPDAGRRCRRSELCRGLDRLAIIELPG
jgi:hypothetical protein